MLVDTHCHLGDPRFDEDRVAVVARARAAGVGHVVVIAGSLPASRQALELARAHGLSATAGVHPHEASGWTAEAESALRALLLEPETVAVGETGLDYHYDHSPRDVQRRVFEAQLALAAELRKPAVVHAREADRDVAEFVRAWAGRIPAIVLHSFSSGPEVLAAGLDHGAYFSFSGMVTFRRWEGGEAVRACPAERLLVETDAPYLSPVPHRGKRNEPAFVTYVASRVAELRGEAAEQVADATTANAGRCYGPRVIPQTTIDS